MCKYVIIICLAILTSGSENVPTNVFIFLCFARIPNIAVNKVTVNIKETVTIYQHI